MDVLRGKRVLVAEDDWVVAHEIARALAKMGVEVVGPAPTLGQCLALIQAERLDRAVLDIKLRGDWVCRAIGALVSRGAPHVFLTGYDRAAILGAYAHVRRFEKPADPRRVIAALFGTSHS
jgi:ActR/RegA family two-component response regulator